jgi:hypothetical protein
VPPLGKQDPAQLEARRRVGRGEAGNLAECLLRFRQPGLGVQHSAEQSTGRAPGRVQGHRRPVGGLRLGQLVTVS